MTEIVAMRLPHHNPAVLEVEHPQCKECGVPMWFTRHVERENHDECTFECQACGASLTRVIIRVSPLATAL